MSRQRHLISRTLGVSEMKISNVSFCRDQLVRGSRSCINAAMTPRGSVLSLLLLIYPALAISQSQPAPQAAPSVLVKAGKLLDVRKGSYIENAGIWIEGERIKEVGGFSAVQSHAPKVKVIDLGRATVLPGLIDCHTHLMARIADTEDGYTLA